LFLKAGLLHPGVGKVLLSVVSEKIIDACFESMLKDATALSARLPLVRAGFEVYRAELLGAKAQMPDAMPWAEMKKDGTFGGFNHNDFWKMVTNFHDGAFAPCFWLLLRENLLMNFASLQARELCQRIETLFLAQRWSK
jgi:hypothetical protein